MTNENRQSFYRSLAAGVFFVSFFAMIIAIGALIVQKNSQVNRSVLTAEGGPSRPAPPTRLVPFKQRIAF